VKEALVLIADDPTVIGLGLRLLLEKLPGFQVNYADNGLRTFYLVQDESAEGRTDDELNVIKHVFINEEAAPLHTSLRKLTSDLSSNEIALPLSPRQREVLKLMAEGHPTKAIALMLKISAKTVETHRALLMERLDIHDIAGLVRYAIRTGVIGLED
jgi:DNA-binding CsgD family transcriptional regulator